MNLKSDLKDSNLEPLPFRKKSAKFLIILTFIAFVLLLSSLVGLIVMFSQGRKNKDVCFTPICIHSAAITLTYMDSTVDPCDNFYKFACGNFIKNEIIPDGKRGVSQFTAAVETVQKQLFAIFDEPPPANVSKPRNFAKTLYKSCMDTKSIEEDGLKTTNLIFKMLGGWPLLEGNKWNQNSFQWDNQIYTFRKYGCDHDFFITLSLAFDSKNMSQRILVVNEAQNIDRSRFSKGFDDASVRTYYTYLLELANEFGIDNKTAASEIRDVINFKIQLAKTGQDSTHSYKSLKNIGILQANYPKIKWLEFIRNIINIPNANITNDEQVELLVPAYVEQLQHLLEKTPKRIIANYMFAETMDSFVPYLQEKLIIKRSVYRTSPKLDLSINNRLRDCKIITVNSGTSIIKDFKNEQMLCFSIGLEFDYLYVKKYFNGQTKYEAEELAQNIFNQFSETLAIVDWLDDDTRKSAIEKVKNMVKHIAYPIELLEYSNVEKYYEKLELNSSIFLKNAMSIRKFQVDRYYSKLYRIFNRTDWLSHTFPAVVNAFYAPYENSILLPAAILQGFFFNKDRPNYMNYGVLGFIVGHEMTHGFDNRGRLYDKEGQMKNWWSEKTKTAFLEKAQCIIEQYENYTLPEFNLTINGLKTQGENIADNGGLKQSYLAYNKWAKRNQPELKLPGLNYTPNQMFWISTAQLWCSKYTNETIKSALKYDPHSPPEYRVIGPFSNSENFTKDFNCPLGSRMNPIKKCSVW